MDFRRVQSRLVNRDCPLANGSGRFVEYAAYCRTDFRVGGPFLDVCDNGVAANAIDCREINVCIDPFWRLALSLRDDATFAGSEVGQGIDCREANETPEFRQPVSIADGCLNSGVSLAS